MKHTVLGVAVSLLVVVPGLRSQQSPAQMSDKPYELKGEAPGSTTLKQFKANHKHADCSNVTTHETDCHVYDGVSFAGVPAAPASKGCTSLECRGQGILGKFIDGQLVSLTYGVEPFHQYEVTEALRSKFGEPTEKHETSWTWKNSVGTLAVVLVSVRLDDGSLKLLTTAITSSLKDQGPKNDI